MEGACRHHHHQEAWDRRDTLNTVPPALLGNDAVAATVDLQSSPRSRTPARTRTNVDIASHGSTVAAGRASQQWDPTWRADSALA